MTDAYDTRYIPHSEGERQLLDLLGRVLLQVSPDAPSVNIDLAKLDPKKLEDDFKVHIRRDDTMKTILTISVERRKTQKTVVFSQEAESRLWRLLQVARECGSDAEAEAANEFIRHLKSLPVEKVPFESDNGE